MIYIFEHGHRWLLHVPGHERFWSPPVFYPSPNALAHSKILLSVAPFYWIVRALGAPPDTALQWWMLTVATLDFISA